MEWIWAPAQSRRGPNGQITVEAGLAAVVAAAALLVELLEDAARIGRCGGNGASDERQGHEGGKNELHDHLHRSVFNEGSVAARAQDGKRKQG